jgi:hypothetical protein
LPPLPPEAVTALSKGEIAMEARRRILSAGAGEERSSVL